MQQVSRRLAAILAMDVVGYTRLMAANDEGTLQALNQRRRELIEPTVDRHRGRVFKAMGDGFLVEFGSVTEAVRCAVEIQRETPAHDNGVPEDRQIRLRIGIDVGDVIAEADDVYGDGVNMAARLQSLAKPGGIACSSSVWAQIGGRLDVRFIDQGEHRLKNIDRPIRIYSIDLSNSTSVGTYRRTGQAGALSLHADRPSIAVLPFTNMSADPDQEYFSDGITEDIITDLSKVSGLFVLGRNTVFLYKGKSFHLKQVATELGVAYLLEGSVRKVGSRVRINAQLIDGTTGGHLWAERYDGDLNDVFALQDEIALEIVDALKVKLIRGETSAITAIPTKSVEAYTSYLRGREFFNRHLARFYPLARTMFAAAVEIDPDFAAAYAGVANSDSFGFLLSRNDAAIAEIRHNSAKALELDPDLAEAHASRGLAHWLEGSPSEAEAEYYAALKLDPTLYEANYFYARFCRAHGRHAEAAKLFERAAELRPADPDPLFVLATEYRLLGEPKAAARASRRALARAERELSTRPENANAAIFSAIEYVRQSDPARAGTLLHQALLAEPNDLRVQFNAACVYALLGESQPALDILERVVPLIPPADQAWTAEDPDLSSLRSLPRFAALLRSNGVSIEQSPSSDRVS